MSHVRCVNSSPFMDVKNLTEKVALPCRPADPTLPSLVFCECMIRTLNPLKRIFKAVSRCGSQRAPDNLNRTARVITKSSYNTISSYLLNSLSWDNLSVRRTKQKANLMYKCVNRLAPNYLCNMFTPRTLSFDLRDSSQKLYLPKPRTDYLKRNFSFSGASLWNDLPEDIRTATSLRNFKTRIDKWLSVSDSHTANV